MTDTAINDVMEHYQELLLLSNDFDKNHDVIHKKFDEILKILVEDFPDVPTKEDVRKSWASLKETPNILLLEKNTFPTNIMKKILSHDQMFIQPVHLKYWNHFVDKYQHIILN